MGQQVDCVLESPAPASCRLTAPLVYPQPFLLQAQILYVHMIQYLRTPDLSHYLLCDQEISMLAQETL